MGNRINDDLDLSSSDESDNDKSSDYIVNYKSEN